jgi:hypothetical protein
MSLEEKLKNLQEKTAENDAAAAKFRQEYADAVGKLMRDVIPGHLSALLNQGLLRTEMGLHRLSDQQQLPQLIVTEPTHGSRVSFTPSGGWVVQVSFIPGSTRTTIKQNQENYSLHFDPKSAEWSVFSRVQGKAPKSEKLTEQSLQNVMENLLI